MPGLPVSRLRAALTLLVGLLLSILLTVAPGALRAGSVLSPTVTVRVLMPSPFVDATAPLVASFNREHPGLRISVDRGPLDTESISDLATGSLLLGSAPYDLLMMDVSWTARYVAAGWLDPLENLLGGNPLAAMEPGARLGNAFGGHLWRMPLTGDTGLLYWRTDLMERPPRTTEELERIATRLQQEGKVRWGYVWQGRQYEGFSCMMLEVIHAFGGRWWEPDGGRAGGHTALDSKAAIAAASWLEGLIQRGVSPAAVADFAENEALQVFAAGDAAFLRNWPYAWQEIAKGGGPVVGKVGVSTVVSAPGIRSGGTLGTWGLSLLHGSAHPHEAAEVIRWFTGPHTQKALVLDQGYAPTWSALYDDPELQRRHPLLAVQREALRQGPLVRPLTPLYAQLSDLLQRHGNGMLSGAASAAQAMGTSQRDSAVLLASASGAASRGETAWRVAATGRADTTTAQTPQ
ncbi:MAG: extracellular solute-binding protein [Cyanobium sp.]